LPWRTTRSLGETHVGGVEVGELADPQAGTQQQLHDRSVAGRAQTIGLALHRAQLLRRERARRRWVDLDTRHARRDQRLRVQQRRCRGEREVDRRGRQSAIDQAAAPIAQDGATVVLAVPREEALELVAGVEVLNEFAHPTAIAGAGAGGQRLAIEPAVVVGENLIGGHARILSEPPDGRLALVAGALCAAQRPWGSEKARCRHRHSPATGRRHRRAASDTAQLRACCPGRQIPSRRG